MKVAKHSFRRSENHCEERGGGLRIEYGSVFTMTGGVVSGNTSDTCGGGVYADSDFTMTGGEISGNSSDDQGGGVYLETGTFEMKGGSITGNSVPDLDGDGDADGGGVYVSNISAFKLSGNADISGNKVKGKNGDIYMEDSKSITVDGALANSSPIGVAMKTPGAFTTGYKARMADADPADYFISDQDGYGVFANTDGEAMLGEARRVTFDKNGGAGEMVPQDLHPGVETALKANTCTRRGHNFKDWNTAADGSGTAYADKAMMTLTENITLYAQWTVHDIIVNAISDQTYTGKAITPAVTVKDGEEVLKAGTDYTVTYENNINAGTATATVTGAGDYADAKPVSVTFTIKKAVPTVTAPAAKNLTCNGQAQALVNAGKATGGTMQYALGTDTTSAPATGWSTSVPVGTNTGSYYVWYKVAGDSNHNDSAPSCVVVKINTNDIPGNQNAGNQSPDSNGKDPGGKTLKDSDQGTADQITISKKPSSVKAKVKKNKVTVSWKKIKKNKSGKKLLKKIKSIQVQYSTDKTFTKNVRTKKVGRKKTKAKLKLRKNTTYYIRVRYAGKSGFSKWSKVKKIKTKKR